MLQSVCVHTDLFPEDILLDTCIWVPAKHRPMYISGSCSSTLSWVSTGLEQHIAHGSQVKGASGHSLGARMLISLNSSLPGYLTSGWVKVTAAHSNSHHRLSSGKESTVQTWAPQKARWRSQPFLFPFLSSLLGIGGPCWKHREGLGS